MKGAHPRIIFFIGISLIILPLISSLCPYPVEVDCDTLNEITQVTNAWSREECTQQDYQNCVQLKAIADDPNSDIHKVYECINGILINTGEQAYCNSYRENLYTIPSNGEEHCWPPSYVEDGKWCGKPINLENSEDIAYLEDREESDRENSCTNNGWVLCKEGSEVCVGEKKVTYQTDNYEGDGIICCERGCKSISSITNKILIGALILIIISLVIYILLKEKKNKNSKFSKSKR